MAKASKGFKRLLTIVLTFVMTVGTLNGVFAASTRYIGEAKAKSVAFKHASVSEKNVSSLRVKLERDDGRYVYDIDFSDGSYKYDYEIDAINGKVRDADRDRIKSKPIPRPRPTPKPESSYIGEKKAKTIAYDHANISANKAASVTVRLTRDDGRYVYEVNFTCGGYRYEYEINAVTGKIHDRDKEKVRTSVNTANYIGEVKAKSIALADARLKESKVTRIKVKLDRGKKKDAYEVEFRNGRFEYEYDIDAESGRILKKEIDR